MFGDDEDDDPPAPAGVRLRDPQDTDGIRDDIEQGVLKGMQRYVNGYEYGGVRLELGDLKYADKPRYSLEEQREALMKDATLARRLRGTVKLIDVETNKPIDIRRNVTLARVPYLTERGTMIHNGTDYAPIMQARLLPGAYTRRRNNGELETHFNVRPGSGTAMRVTLDPVTAQYRIKVGSSNVHAYSLFRDLGVTDEELERRWGPDILQANKASYDSRALDRVYRKAIKYNRDDKLPREQKAQLIREAFDRAQVAESVLRDNLPNLFSREKAASWRREGAAIEKAASEMEKSAAFDTFCPDLDPEELIKAATEFDFELDYAMEKLASGEFDPDLDPRGMRESYNNVYGHQGPRLASMKAWPEHWLNDADPQGWLQWYENYAAGRRHEDDERQIRRWTGFKRRHGAAFMVKPTPRRAFALRNWAIDPIKLLPADKRESFQAEMDKYRREKYMAWALTKFDFDQDKISSLLHKARQRGAVFEEGKNVHKTLMTLALEGHIQPEDLK